jgi:subtilisin-like proprotein convertase family protein
MRRLLLLSPLLLLALAGSAPAATSTYTSHQLHTAIPDVGSVTSRLQVPDAGPVTFLAVGVRIQHPRDADLTLSLISPRGTRVVLSRAEGGAGANYGSGPKGCSGDLAWFESDALDAVSTQKAPFANDQRPEQPLTRLYGQEARGPWSLRVDDTAPGAAGTLLCWQLELSRNVVSHITLSRGAVSADLSYRETHGSYSDLRVAIRRHGRVAFSDAVARVACHDCAVSGLSAIFNSHPLTIRDLDGDGEPEVLVDLYTGGAHCCFYTVVFRWDGQRYRGSPILWGDPGYELRDLNHDGRPELVTADDRFAYTFTYYAASALPIRILHYDHGRFVDATGEFPALVRSEAAELRSEYLKTRGPDADVRGILAAYLADEYRLGRSAEGWQLVDEAYRRGDVSTPRVDAIWPAGQKYLTALRSFLAKSGYAG